MKRITINDVAERANVSKSTVSHYLNNRFSYMGSDTKERIAKAVEELNYNPNFIAKSLKNKKTMTVGIIVANILHSFSTQIIRAIEDYFYTKDYHVIVCNADDDPVKEKSYVQMLMSKQVDGLIVIPTLENELLFKDLYEQNFPVVFIDRYIEGLSIPSYLLNNALAIENAFNYLLEKKHKEIGFISQPVKNITPRVERKNAYLKSCQTHGIKPFTLSTSLDNLHTEIKNHLENNTMPSSLIVANDLALLEVLRSAKETGTVIPRDLSIISIDDIEFTEFFNPSLTVIAQPTFEIGKAAARGLFHTINHEHTDYSTHRFNHQFIERSSVKHEN
ncbi:LacI family DNA-binding transcriptional regulator [Corticicoccus populi]|uniref:LacI family DNA-binding transcriptional regulator n=1 Tax=Corticicoccus populi TaxID=1812821 RepID=A0ABW5WYL4_9STAP